MRAQTGERRDDLAEGDVGHGDAALLGHLGKAGRRGVGALLVLDVFGCGANNEIAVDGGRDEHALAHLGGKRKDHVVHVVACSGVKKHVLSAARDNLQLVLADHVVNLVRVDACSIHHAARKDAAAWGLKGKAALRPALDGRNRGIKDELDSVGCGILGKGNVQPKGINDAGRWRPERADGIRRNVGLHGTKRVSVNNLEVGHTIGHTSREELAEPSHVALACAHDEGANVLDCELQLLCQLVHEGVALDIESSHERAGHGVVTGVHDGRVGLGRATADVILALDHADARRGLRKLSCRGAAGDTGPNDHDVVAAFPLLHRPLLVSDGWTWRGQPETFAGADYPPRRAKHVCVVDGR